MKTQNLSKSTAKDPKKKPKGRRILDLCDDWMDNGRNRDRNRHIVSSYYSGKKMETDEDQETLGLNQHHNYQVGRSTIEQAFEEDYSAWTSPRRLMNFKLKTFDGTPRDKLKLEEQFSKCVDKMIREDDPIFLEEIKQMSSNRVMHGDSVMCFHPTGEDWRPFWGRIITDKDAPQNPANDNFTQWAISHDIQVSDALEGIANDDPGWQKGAKKFLQRVMEKKYSRVREGGTNAFEQILAMIRQQSYEEWTGPLSGALSDFYATTIKVFYFYEKDFSQAEDGVVPVNLSIVSRMEILGSDDGKAEPLDESGDINPLLYFQEEAFDSVQQAIYPFVQDSNMGIEHPTWGTIRGLGWLNYDADRMSNILISSMVNQAIDKNTTLYQLQDSGVDTRQLREFLKNGYRAYSVMPSGVDLFKKDTGSLTIDESLAAIQSIQRISSQNAISHTGQSQGEREELRVNAARRHDIDAKIANNRGLIHSKLIQRFLKEKGRRICEGLTQDAYDGRARRQIEDLKKELDLKEVEWLWFQTDNIEVTYTRLSGDGDPQRRIQISQTQLENIGLYSPEKRPEILRSWHAALTDNWEEADEMFVNDTPPADQTILAAQKASAIMQFGTPLPVTKEDIPELQLPTLIGLAQGVVTSAAERGAFEPEEYRGIVALGQYAMQLVQLMEQRGDQQAATIFAQEIQRISTEAEGPRRNMEAGLQAQQSPEMLFKQQELSLKDRSQTLKEEQAVVELEKSVARQEGQNQRQAHSEFVQNSRLAIEESRENHRREMDELKLENERLKTQIANSSRN